MSTCECNFYGSHGYCTHTGMRPLYAENMPDGAYRVAPHDIVLEREILGLALTECAEDTSVFQRQVGEGLAVGDRLYGRRFEGRDNLSEAYEEVTDSVCYLILELERLRGNVPSDLWQELRMASVAGVLAAYRLHAAIRVCASVRDSHG